MIDRRLGPTYVKRGLDAERTLHIIDEGEFIYSTDKKRLFIGDGTTKGGVLVSNKNYVANNTTISNETVYGDIIFNKSTNKTYIIGYDLDGKTLIAILICDLNICADLNTKLDAVSGKYEALRDCLQSYPTTIPKINPALVEGQLYYTINPPTNIATHVGDSITIDTTVFDSISVLAPLYQEKLLKTISFYKLDKPNNIKVNTSIIKNTENSITIKAILPNLALLDAGTYFSIYNIDYVDNFKTTNVISVTSKKVNLTVSTRT